MTRITAWELANQMAACRGYRWPHTAEEIMAWIGEAFTLLSEPPLLPSSEWEDLVIMTLQQAPQRGTASGSDAAL